MDGPHPRFTFAEMDARLRCSHRQWGSFLDDSLMGDSLFEPNYILAKCGE